MSKDKSLEQEIEEILHTELFVNSYDEVAGHKDAKNKLLHLIDTHCQKRELEARIDELRYYPLNWAYNRNEKVWAEMVLSRIDQLKQTSIKDGGDSDD